MEWWQYLIVFLGTMVFITIVWLIGQIIVNKKINRRVK